MEENLSWSDLPAHPLLGIFSFLPVRDLLSCSLVNLHWNFYSCENSLWKPLTEKTWLISKLSEGETSFRQIYITFMKKFGKYVSCYAEIRSSWNVIIEELKANDFQHILTSLSEGATEEEIDEYEQINDIQLPKDLRLSHLLYDGQNATRRTIGLFGSYQFYDYSTNFIYMKLNLPPKANFIPVVYSNSSSSAHYLDLLSGKVVVFGLDGKSYFEIAGSWKDYLSEFAINLKSKNYEFDKQNSQIVRYPSKVGISEESTNSVDIQVSPLFVPEQSSFSKYFFAYRIRMKMTKDSPPENSCVLQKRHWIIRDGNGKVEEVSGPGVIGEYPQMFPGASFEYSSCCPLITPTGSMHGTFQMKYRTKEMKDVVVPQFHFISAPIFSLQTK